MIYRNIVTGDFLRLVKKGRGRVNTFILVDKNNKPKLRCLFGGKELIQQAAIMVGFDKLELIK